VSRRIPVLLLLLAAAAFPQDRRRSDRLARFKLEWRKIDQKSGFGTQRKQYIRLAQDIAKLGTREAVQFLIPKTRDPRYAAFHGDLLRLLAKYAAGNEEVEFLMREHMAPDDPYRGQARTFLYDRALRKRDDVWLLDFFSMGEIEDRFLALRGLGVLSSPAALESAESLARDRTWKPGGPLVNCGTIAAAVKDAEGQRAARLLLLLQRDPRFQPRDHIALRTATRLWHQSDLRAYIELTDLASPDAVTRADTAEFMGRAGIESARAPLIRLALNRKEDADVRAAAARALGGLRIAKGALVARLSELLLDNDPDVRVAAIEGLGGLRVRQSANTLVELLGGPYERHAVQALMRVSGLTVDTDWRAWAENPLFRLPEGT
jgi:HEAT repeat protein